jgi:hypothetical protein
MNTIIKVNTYVKILAFLSSLIKPAIKWPVIITAIFFLQLILLFID